MAGSHDDASAMQIIVLVCLVFLLPTIFPLCLALSSMAIVSGFFLAVIPGPVAILGWFFGLNFLIIAAIYLFFMGWFFVIAVLMCRMRFKTFVMFWMLGAIFVVLWMKLVQG
jgi:hypothetical protein